MRETEGRENKEMKERFIFQDALDLISGRYTVGTNSPSQLQLSGSQPSVCSS